ncbi:hypothetical protein LTR97_005270 [Elasticomyces elasticus]|uniref:Mitochondrial K+-H+ exchange-related-domain-containing protein n=1 Tax=Elasticomyces elasticus TaxID=574655 RepID=A0AAN7WK78_9PEZI|nr:hypothetical protein LTR97_005270 [Elasticomyces elasticus]
MRIFLLPVSTRRTLIYCERVQHNTKPGQPEPYTERIVNKAAQTWAGFEKAEKGWRKQLTYYGNQLFKRIPYEEWGLKSFPPATKQRLEEVDQGKHGFECLYPGTFMKGRSVTELLKKLATERQAFHRRSMWTSIVWLPITIPFALVPVIPNIPFFWFAFRAYSHYRALYGGMLLDHITTKGLVQPRDSRVMDELYAAGLLNPTRQASRESTAPGDAEIAKVVAQVEDQQKQGDTEVVLLQRWNGKLIAEAFELSEMEIEIERAVEQVEKAIQASDEKTGAKTVQESATGQPDEKVHDETKR